MTDQIGWLGLITRRSQVQILPPPRCVNLRLFGYEKDEAAAQRLSRVSHSRWVDQPVFTE